MKKLTFFQDFQVPIHCSIVYNRGNTGAKADYDLLKGDAPEIAEKIKSILLDILAHPASGLGNPIALDGPFVGLWQRNYSLGHVVVYSFDDEKVRIISIGAREAALEKIPLESYSRDDEKSVMDQMSANRGHDGEPKVGIGQSWR